MGISTRLIILPLLCLVVLGESLETKCYFELGCFPMGIPWTTPLRPFPSPLPPEDIDTKITLYTRNYPQGIDITLWPKINLKGSDFEPKRAATVLLTHGYTHNGKMKWVLNLKDAYLEKVDANVFVVDWGKGSFMINYLQVASNTRIVGAELTRFGKHLLKEGLKADKMHLIGHSMGAHVMAYMAKGLKSIAHVRRITALDPAQPGFEGTDPEVRLAKGDAQFIDAIHSDAKPFIPFLSLGMIQPVGDVDFYMNGGADQPGCTIMKIPSIKDIMDLAKQTFETITEVIECSHSRSFQYFTWALKLNNCAMWGRKIPTILNHLILTPEGTIAKVAPLINSLDKCDERTCSVVGLNTFKLKARGAFVVSTKSSEPYCDTSEVLTWKLNKLIPLVHMV